MFNPFTLEIIRNAFTSVAEEMSTGIWRTSRSTPVREILDYSTAVFDNNGNIISQSTRNPIHLNSLSDCLKIILFNYFSLSDLNEGDIILVNDPYCGGQHLPDLQVFSPVIFNKKIISFVGALCHHTDVGGGAPGSYYANATEIFHEGLRIPPLKIRNKGILDQNLIDIIKFNVREPEKLYGDLISQIASLDIGIKRLINIYKKYSVKKCVAVKDEILKISEKKVRENIKLIKNCKTEFEDYLDDDGLTNKPIKIHCELIINDDYIIVDLNKSDDQATGPINCAEVVTKSAVYYSILSVICQDIPVNSGSFIPIIIKTRKGSIVNCSFPSPVSGRMATAHRIVNVIHGAFSNILSTLVPSAYYGVSYVYALSANNREGNRGIYFEIEVGGAGASPNSDGVNAISCGVHNIANTPIEMIEQEHQILFTKYQLDVNSAGSGKYRGGFGLIREWKLEADNGTFSANLERFVFPPLGIDSGGNGKLGKLVHFRNGNEKYLPSKISNYKLIKGDIIALHTSGGGGYGLKSERDIKRINFDQKNYKD